MLGPIRVSDSAGLRWDLKICVSSKFSDDADAVGDHILWNISLDRSLLDISPSLLIGFNWPLQLATSPNKGFQKVQDSKLEELWPVHKLPEPMNVLVEDFQEPMLTMWFLLSVGICQYLFEFVSVLVGHGGARVRNVRLEYLNTLFWLVLQSGSPDLNHCWIWWNETSWHSQRYCWFSSMPLK